MFSLVEFASSLLRYKLTSATCLASRTFISCCSGSSWNITGVRKNLLLRSAWSVQQKRNHWRSMPKKRAPYTKPVNFDYSGDVDTSIGPVDLKALRPGYKNIPELQEADENVKKIFSLEYGTNSVIVDHQKKQLLDKVKEHPLDLESLEVKIAKSTIAIRNNIKHCVKFRHDKMHKTRLIQQINRRKGLLRELKMQDIDKFNWLTQELHINYSDDPPPKKLSKAEVRKKIADDAAEEARKKKLKQFHQKLQEDRIKFDQFKEKEMEDIESKLREIGISEKDMISFEKTLEALGHAEMVPRPKPHITEYKLRYLKLCEKLMPEKKKRDTEILHAHGFLTPEELLYYPEDTPKF